jgi:hypothetical protein
MDIRGNDCGSERGTPGAGWAGAILRNFFGPFRQQKLPVNPAGVQGNRLTTLILYNGANGGASGCGREFKLSDFALSVTPQPKR